jgi:hypothetical protein
MQQDVLYLEQSTYYSTTPRCICSAAIHASIQYVPEFYRAPQRACNRAYPAWSLGPCSTALHRNELASRAADGTALRRQPNQQRCPPRALRTATFSRVRARTTLGRARHPHAAQQLDRPRPAMRACRPPARARHPHAAQELRFGSSSIGQRPAAGAPRAFSASALRAPRPWLLLLRVRDGARSRFSSKVTRATKRGVVVVPAPAILQKPLCVVLKSGSGWVEVSVSSLN